MRDRQWVLAGFAVSGILLAACTGSAGGGSGAGGSHNAAPAAGRGAMVLKSGKTSAGMVLANAQGRTLYWFSIDTPAQSRCTGACVAAWPPATGRPQLVPGLALPGKLATIKRADGMLQITYHGHPLYTYAGDRAPGQANGNGVHGFGGLWHAVTLPGTAGSASSSSPGPSRRSGAGYGY